VFALTFHRVKFNRNYKPAWDNVDLGRTSDYAYLHRLLSLLKGAFRLFPHRRHMANADFIFARNIDMVLLALFARLITGVKAPIAYEVLDVHRFFLGNGRKSKVLRALERWVLRRVDALIVSSEGYIRNYFAPLQNYDGPWYLLENKVPAGSVEEPAEPPKHRPKTLGRPWVIGWCGTMRCVKSLHLLTEIARCHRDTVQIYMRGYPTETGMDEFLAHIENEPNMIYGGGYKGPDDLAAVYSEVDLNWTIELWDASYKSDNSLWLLPNRLYEGGCCNIPPIALAGTETARRIKALDIGWVIEEPLDDAISALLNRLTEDDYRAKRNRLEALPMSTFWEIDDLQQICNQLMTQGATKNGAMASA